METSGKQKKRIPWTKTLQVLSNTRRRAVLYCLKFSAEAEVSLRPLIYAVQRVEYTLPETSHPTPTDDLKVTLCHVDLQKLGSAETVDYDRQSRTVAYTPVEPLDRMVEYLGHQELPSDHTLLQDERLPDCSSASNT